MRRSYWFVLSAVLSVTFAAPGFAEWQAPRDGAFTEKQLVTYLQIQKEAIDNLRAAGKAIEGSQSGAAAMALYLNNDAKFKASLAAHGMSREEYDWLVTQVWQAWGGVLMDQMLASTQATVAEQKKTNEKRVAELKQKLAVYQKAQSQGRRVMTREDRESAAQSAKSDQQSALDEAKQHGDELKQAREEAAKAEAEAKAADAQAANPPADVSADDRAAFIDQKKTEAQQARDAAKEGRDKEAELKKLQDEANAKAAEAARKSADPDVPVTEEEKAEVKKTNDEQIASLTTEITDGERGLKLLDESGQTFAKTMEEQKAKNPVPTQNLTLLKKHQAEFENAWGMKADIK